MNKLKWFLQEEAGGEKGGGGGQVNAQDARTYLAGFGHSADALKGMADPDVLKLHGTVTGSVKKATEDAIKTAGGNVDWPSDWRQRLAGQNEQELKQLERYAAPPDIWKKTRSLEQKMSSGELKTNLPFPEKGTAEEQAAWRKDREIPEKPEGYDYSNLGDGVVIGDDDKPLVGEFLKFSHSRHTPQSVVKDTLSWFFGDYREKVEAQRAEAERDMMQRAEDDLRKDWGPDYRPNMNAITGLLDGNVSSESGMKGRILKSIKLEPEFAKLWASLARQINPVSTLTGIDSARISQSVDEEIAKIERTMREDRRAYNQDEKMQARYRELLDARERMKGQKTTV